MKNILKALRDTVGTPEPPPPRHSPNMRTITVPGFDPVEVEIDEISARISHVGINSPAFDKAFARLLVSPPQGEIKPGDHFVAARGTFVWGRAKTLDEVAQEEIDLGAPAYEAIETQRKVEKAMSEGFLYATMYSEKAPDGETGFIHRMITWPVTSKEYEEASTSGWHLDREIALRVIFSLTLELEAMKKRLIDSKIVS
jgi:hypothetical protein